MVQLNTQIKDLFDVKAHLGHKTSRVHPKARKFIYTVENGISIIDLTSTSAYLEEAKKFVRQLAEENKILLIVCTKRVASGKVQEISKQNSIPFVCTKWPAGLITNFETITKNIKKLIQMRKDKAEGVWEKYVKHDQIKLDKELSKLTKAYDGLTQITKLPDALFVVDVKKEKNAVDEANKLSIPVVAIADTNVDPGLVAYPIPANDDSLSSVEYIVNIIVEAYAKHRTDQTSKK